MRLEDLERRDKMERWRLGTSKVGGEGAFIRMFIRRRISKERGRGNGLGVRGVI